MKVFTKHWNHYLEAIPTNLKDIYFSEEYVKLYETECEKAYCFVYQDEYGTLLFPFLRREFNYKGNTYYDFETVYGYGGPISNNHSEEFMTKTLQIMVTEANKENYICGFVRFHPLLSNWNSFDKVGAIILDRKTIAIDLTGGINHVWINEIHSKNRNVIKKGEKCGLEFIVDNNFEYIEEFKQLYNCTMDKHGADEFYYFSPAYFNQLINTINNCFLGIVMHDGKVISGAIFFYQLPYGHYHLAGSHKSTLYLSPNNFLLWNAAKELTNRGVRYFHLGGGYDNSKDNTLYQYKRKFSKCEYQFALGKMIFNTSLYKEICDNWERENPDKMEKMKHILLKYKY